MIKFHPNDSTLVSFVEGTLSSTRSLMISAHCDFCKSCLNKTIALTNATANTVFTDGTLEELPIRDYVCMFEFITRDTSIVNTCVNYEHSSMLEVNGHKFKLPKSLARFSRHIREWTYSIGKIWHAPFDLGGGVIAQLIYIEKGGEVPQHTHIGEELTLVLDGHFSDGNNVYTTGDYITLTENHTHTPQTNSKEGCLAIVILDAPIHFTTHWAKLTNPLSHLFFKTDDK